MKSLADLKDMKCAPSSSSHSISVQYKVASRVGVAARNHHDVIELDSSRCADGYLETVGAYVSAVLATEAQIDAPLMAAGIDSLGATELQQALCEDLSTQLPSTFLFDHPSISRIAELLARNHHDSTALLSI